MGPRTLELGPEPPALANFLVHDFRVTAEAVPATVIDLAARNLVDIEQRGPGVFYVRVRPPGEHGLTAYERLVLGLLVERASDGVVPAEALTTGPERRVEALAPGIHGRGGRGRAGPRALGRLARRRSLLRAHGGRGDTRPPRRPHVGCRTGRGRRCRGNRAAQLDARQARPARDACGAGGCVALAGGPRRARGERGLLVAFTADRRALEPAALVRGGARRRVGRQPSASHGRRVRHTCMECLRRPLAARADLVSAPLAAGVGEGASARAGRSAWCSSSCSACFCTSTASRDSRTACSESVPSPQPASASCSAAAAVVMAASDWRNETRGDRCDPQAARTR